MLQSLLEKCLDLAEKMIFPREKISELEHMTTAENEKQIVEFNEDLHYLGDLKGGEPEGEGKVVLVSEGISYNGEFHEGKKHGMGYLVNNSLDTLYCEFVEDELCGI